MTSLPNKFFLLLLVLQFCKKKIKTNRQGIFSLVKQDNFAAFVAQSGAGAGLEGF